MNCQICKTDTYHSLTFTDCICCFGKNKVKTTKCTKSNCQFYYHEQCAYNYILGQKSKDDPQPYDCPMKCGIDLPVKVPYKSFDDLKQQKKAKKIRKQTLFKHWILMIFYPIMCVIFDIYYGLKFDKVAAVWLPVYIFIVIFPTYHIVYMVYKNTNLGLNDFFIKYDKILIKLTIFQYLCKFAVMIPVILYEYNLINIVIPIKILIHIAVGTTHVHYLVPLTCIIIIGAISMVMGVITLIILGIYECCKCMYYCCINFSSIRSELRKSRENKTSTVKTSKLVTIKLDDMNLKKEQAIPIATEI